MKKPNHFKVIEKRAGILEQFYMVGARWVSRGRTYGEAVVLHNNEDNSIKKAKEKITRFASKHARRLDSQQGFLWIQYIKKSQENIALKELVDKFSRVQKTWWYRLFYKLFGVPK